MENQVQLSNTHQNSIALNGKEIEIAKIIYHVNQLTSFPLSATQIEDWTRTISEIRPNQDLIKLRAIINMMKIGEIEYNSRIGIQNLFLALKKYDKIQIGYTIRENYMYNPRVDANSPKEIKTDYYEGDSYPKDMIWLVDKGHYESILLEPTVPEYDNKNMEWN
jgi:hypothetical protein